ncbi:DUF3050 domain-containing protein [uncultured Thiodictyon sp.]|uniref:DUF3050 domain-containing protein n=1 Tax=uncultured Thiodictyon sp. TaxID=1846217 RepID=UPI0025E32A27|nr:DUF3050 domain-containing protein [uncultured Thiodictyon sp.]
MAAPNLQQLRPLQDQLNAHPIYSAIRERRDLRIFMSHHVFSVWDLMSLIKYLQGHLAPVQVPWMPQGDPALRHCINQLVLEQESDSAPTRDGGVRYASQFEYYCQAMNEVGADGENPKRFLALVAERGVDQALYSDLVPVPARYFSETTFGFIRENKPHEVAAALVMGREHLIPGMFRQFLTHMALTPDQAPSFHYYLNRHLHLDENGQGPLALRLLDYLCDNDAVRLGEAETAGEEALCARLRLWDGVLEAIETGRR